VTVLHHVPQRRDGCDREAGQRQGSDELRAAQSQDCQRPAQCQQAHKRGLQGKQVCRAVTSFSAEGQVECFQDGGKSEPRDDDDRPAQAQERCERTQGQTDDSGGNRDQTQHTRVNRSAPARGRAPVR